jgi:mono/diheme cytochrome c family protein
LHGVRQGGAAGIAIAAVAVAGLFGFGAGLFPSSGSRDLNRGAAIYSQACASCHGADLQGQPDWRVAMANGRLRAPPHTVDGHTWHHSDSVLLEIMTRGTAAVVGGGYESDMPGFGESHSQQELEDVLAWIKTHWPERERAFQAELTTRDQVLKRRP